MKVGIHVTVDGREGRRAAWLRCLADTVEGLGFDAIWMGDHIVEFASYASRHPYRASGIHPATAARTPGRYEPFLALTAVASWTSRLRVGTAVTLLTERSPVLTAVMATTLDHLSDGRFDLGVGVGWLREEHQALGVPFEDRGRRCDEYLAAMMTLWAPGAATFHGDYVSFDDVLARPEPLTRPHPPLYVGGSSEAALRRAARFGDGWLPVFLAGEQLRSRLDALAAHVARAGRDAGAVPVMPMYVLDDPEEQAQRARALWHGRECARLGLSGMIIKPRIDERSAEPVLRALAGDLLG